MRYLFAFLVFFFIFLSSFNSYAHASENFLVSSDVTYTVSENGATHVIFAIDLTNTTSQYYASSYKISLGLDNILNVSARDLGGLIDPQVLKTDTGYTIEVEFNKQVVGLGNTLSFTIEFDTPDIAQKEGKIWSINIPGTSNNSEFSDFNVHINVPKSFGSPVYSKPLLPSGNLNFSKEDLGTSGVSLGFGTEQSYNFTLIYHISNAHVFPIKTEIALPPSTNYQDVNIQNIEPKPTNVIQDKDGNWLAEYTLLPSKKQDIIVKGFALVSLYPKKEIISESRLQEYLRPLQYWESQQKEVVDLAKKLKTPRAIYDYVVQNLTYDFSRVVENQERLGAKKTLNNPKSAVCLEFTDLFVALARAADIPARELNGFAYTENSKQRPLSLVKDILHAWPEYYDREKQSWMMVDPTWGNTTGGTDYFTTLDFDHFVFVIKGVNSTYPIPAGGYKLPGMEKQKDVYVDFTEVTQKKITDLNLYPNIPNVAFPGSSIQGSVLIENIGTSVYPASSLIVKSDILEPKTAQFALEDIPPFGSINYPFRFNRTSFLTNQDALVTMQVDSEAVSEKVFISFFSTNSMLLLTGGVFLASSIAIIIWVIAKRTRRVSLPQLKG